MDWDLITSSANQRNKQKKLKFIKLSNKTQKISAYVAIFLMFAAILLNATDNLNYPLILEQSGKLVSALLTTLAISLMTLFFSVIGGFLFYIAMKSKNVFISTFFSALGEIVMGTPLLVMIFLIVYVFGIFFNINSKFLLGILSLTCYMIPYVANAYESSSAVIDKDQYTVMDLYNFSTYKRYRYVILPQMIKPLIPAMLNNLSSIIKGSALLKIVSISEISYVITVISNKNYASIEGYLIMWVMYLMITIPLSVLASNLGKRYAK